MDSSFSPHDEVVEKPIITIITVVFNAGKFLEQTILSVLEQKHHKIDFIVIDGGSKDETLSIIERYKSKIHYWVSEPDKGIYDAFNKGWNAAREDSYILYLGAGDKIISLPDDSIIYNSQVLYGRVILENETYLSKADFRLKLGNIMHHQALLVKKSLSPTPPFDIRFKTYADFDFNQRLYIANVKFTYSDNLLSYALPGGVSHRFNLSESISIVKKNFGIAYAFFACLYYLFQNIKNRFRSGD